MGGSLPEKLCSRERENRFARIGVGAPLACARTHDDQYSTSPIKKQKIELTEIGKIIENTWNDIPNQFDSVSLDEFIIMPNHLHGVVIIKQRAQASGAPTLGNVVQAFKSKCTMEYLQHFNNNNQNTSGKIWQGSYHDQIIRDEESLNKIRDYIRNNPLTWEEDKNNLMQQPAAVDHATRGN